MPIRLQEALLSYSAFGLLPQTLCLGPKIGGAYFFASKDSHMYC